MQLNEIGGYQLLDLIGEGGQGAVYRAHDPASGQIVAVKILSSSISDGEFLARFQREASILATIQHPNVVKVFDHGEENGRHYIVTEFVTENLERILDRGGKLPIQRAISVTKQVAEALAVSHSAGITHRDIKPANILINDQGDIKLIDFGIATAESLTNVTSTNATVGTPLYMSPEQIQGDNVDQRSDIYSLGCVFYQMITGTPPFNGKSTFDIFNGHINKMTEPVALIINESIPELEETIMKSMSKDREQRFQNADEFIFSLDIVFKILEDGPSTVARTRVMPKGLGTQIISKPLTSKKSSNFTTPKSWKIPVVILSVISVIAIVGGSFFIINRGNDGVIGAATGVEILMEESTANPIEVLPNDANDRLNDVPVTQDLITIPERSEVIDIVGISEEPVENIQNVLDKGIIPFETEIFNEILIPNQIHRYSFYGKTDQVISINMRAVTSGQIDSKIELFDPIDKMETWDDDGGGNYNAFISQWSLRTSGEYVIEASAGEGSGEYILELNVINRSVSVPTFVPQLFVESDTGESDSDNITNAINIKIFVVDESSDQVSIYRGNDISIGNCSSENDWNNSPESIQLEWFPSRICFIDTETFPEGEHQIYYRIENLFGVVSEPSPSVNLFVDRTISVPTKPDMIPESDTGVSSKDDTTSEINPTFSGVADPGNLVTLIDNDEIVIGTATTTQSGLWTITSEDLSDGEHTIVAKTEDIAGNISDLSEPIFVTVESSPSLPSDIDLVPLSDSGDSNSDNITNITTPIFQGTSTPGTKIEIHDAQNALLGSSTVDDSGKWKIESRNISHGEHVIYARTIDLSGNETESEAPLSILIDTEITDPSEPVLSANSDTGLSDTDNITTDTTPTFTGYSDPNVLIELRSGSVLLATGYSNSRGFWSITSGDMFGEQSVYARAMDRAGNLSHDSDEVFVNINVKGIGQSSSPDLLEFSDSGIVYDDITSETILTFQGAAKPLSNIELFTSNGYKIGEGKADNMGIWVIETSRLSEGYYNVFAKISDLAGNEGDDSTSINITIDTTAPNELRRPTLTIIDDVTMITGNGESGSLIKLYTDTGEFIDDTLVYAGYWEININSLSKGQYLIKYTETDLAGNTSIESTGLPVTIQGDSIERPQIEYMWALNENGNVVKTSISFNGRPQFEGTSEPYAHVTLYDRNHSIGEGDADGRGVWRIALYEMIDEGSYTIFARAKTREGIDSMLSLPYSFEVVPFKSLDTPSRPIMMIWDDQYEKFIEENPTMELRPVLQGNSEPYNEITAYIIDSKGIEKFFGHDWADEEGQWSIYPDRNLEIGTFEAYAIAYDPDTKQKSEPSESTYLTIKERQIEDTEIIGAFVYDEYGKEIEVFEETYIPLLEIRGFAEPDMTITLYEGNEYPNGEFISETQSDEDTGEWYISMEQLLDVGNHDFYAVAYDFDEEYDEEYITVSKDNFRIRIIPPPSPYLNEIYQTIYVDPYEGTYLSFQGIGEPGLKINLYAYEDDLDEDDLIGEGYVNDSGEWTVNIEEGTPPGDHFIYAVAYLNDFQYANGQGYSYPSSDPSNTITVTIPNEQTNVDSGSSTSSTSSTAIGEWSGSTGTINIAESDYFDIGSGALTWSINEGQKGFFYAGEGGAAESVANVVEGNSCLGSSHNGYDGADTIDAYTDLSEYEYSSGDRVVIGICSEVNQGNQGLLVFRKGETIHRYGVLQFVRVLSNSDMIMNYWLGNEGVTNFSDAPQPGESDF
jgi:serine/threonine protein kinase